MYLIYASYLWPVVTSHNTFTSHVLYVSCAMPVPVTESPVGFLLCQPFSPKTVLNCRVLRIHIGYAYLVKKIQVEILELENIITK